MRAQRVNLTDFHAERPVFARPAVDRSKRFKREALVE